MLRWLIPFALALPLAAHAHSNDRWDDGWSGDDERSWQYGDDGDNNDWDDDSGAYHRARGPSIDDFHAGLDEYGRWIDTPEYGTVWQPTQVGFRWQPYWDGRWVWTTAGWLWVTDEPWGWATYHYGRWAPLDGVGWVWLPGRVWAPAWVAWRWGGGYAGWCPLGPRGVVYVQPRTWVFVESAHFLSPVRHHAVPVSDVTTFWSRAQPLSAARPSPRAGPPPRIVEQQTRVPVRAVPVTEAQSLAPTRPLPSGAVPVWRPRSAPYARPGSPAWPAGQPSRAQQARPAQPSAAQPQSPSQPARSSQPVQAQPGRAERPERAEPSRSSARPHAQPLSGARRQETK